MKPIVVKDQVPLGVARAVQLAVSGMSYRLLRSGITTAILALAVAFLVHVLTHAILAEATQRSAYDALQPMRDTNVWLSRLTTPDSPAAVRDRLVPADHRARLQRAEYAVWLGESADLDSAQELARASQQIERWTDRLSPAQAAVILGGQPLNTWLDRLSASPDARARWLTQLDTFRLDPPLGGFEKFEQWLSKDRAALQTATVAIREGHAKAIERFVAADSRPLLDRFAEPSDTLHHEIRDASFAMDGDILGDITDYAAYRQSLTRVLDTLEDPAIKQALERETGGSDVSVAMKFLGTDEGAAWWAKHARPTSGVQHARPIAHHYLSEQRLLHMTDGYEPITRHTPFGLPVGTLWLVGLSLLVCVVGVTNALLMSVTERFNEIATMKCLGALDRSVMQMFVAEAVIQGVIGGVAGVLLGLLLTLLRGLAEFGTLLSRGLSGWTELLSASALSLAIGVLLAAFAAIGPSWVASRLAPMEAMRVE